VSERTLRASMVAWLLSLLLLLLLSSTSISSAQSYSWQVNYQHVTLDINQTGNVVMTYRVDANIVEGTWTEVWIPATRGDMQITSVVDDTGKSHSFYIDGDQIKTQDYNLQPGDHVNLIITSTLPGFVYKSNKTGYDIVSFIPPWWDMAIQDTSVKYILPAEVNVSQVFTGTREYSGIGTENGRTIVYFNNTYLSNNQRFDTAVSFPDSYMAPGAVTATSDTTGDYTTGDNNSDGILGFCGLTSCFFPLFILGFIFWVFVLIAGVNRRQYSSPTVKMDGVGVNKDLDPVEAAMLLRADPRRVLTQIMFGLLKKGNVKLISTEPLRLEPVSRQGVNYYEKLFMDAIKDDKLNENGLLTCFKVLAQRVVDKTRPFCRKDTEAYYKQKIDEAWEDVKAVDTPELKLEKYDAKMFWLLADENFATKTKDYLQSPGWNTYTVPPIYWWYPYYMGIPSHQPTTAGTAQPSAAGPAPTNQTTSSVETLANNVSNGVEAFAGGIVGKVDSFLGVRNAANAPPAASAGSSGGSSCAHCACACASCACACACAGGGGGCT